jgi:hypothetical protein
VRELLQHVVIRLGHEPVYEDGTPNGSLGDVDVILLEPAHRPGLAAAKIVRLRDESIPVVCASIEPPDGSLAALKPVAYLLKPFSLPELEHALTKALAQSKA